MAGSEILNSVRLCLWWVHRDAHVVHRNGRGLESRDLHLSFDRRSWL